MLRFLRIISVFFLATITTSVFAKSKSQAYYNSHEAEILPDAQVAFREGKYERAVELCRWHYVIVGDEKADTLREMAARSVAFRRKLLSLR